MPRKHGNSIIKRNRQAKPFHALITIAILMVVMLYIVVINKGAPHVPLIIGCTTAAGMAAVIGFSWDEILGFMIDGISQSLEAIMILLLIGCLAGVWIASGTVPAMIYYGLSLLNAKYFLAVCALICMIVSFTIGAWGTVGTVGIALMGIGAALRIPLPLIAGCIVSGAYFGDAVSPLSDATNLSAAVVGRDVFSVVKSRVAPVTAAFFLSVVIYFFVGLHYSTGGGVQVADSIEPLRRSLGELFNVSPVCFLPMLVVVVCILRKVPAIPSMLLGVVSAAVIAVLAQGTPLNVLIAICTDGAVSVSGVEMIDALLTAGGMLSMMSTISIVIFATAFGGVMQGSGQMRALISPLVSRLRGFGALNGVTVLSCVLMNILLPDQYLSISLPGQMLQEEYDSRGYDRVALGLGLVGGSASSPIVPWNTCGLYCLTVLGVSATEYMRHAYFCILTLILLVALGFFRRTKPMAASR